MFEQLIDAVNQYQALINKSLNFIREACTEASHLSTARLDEYQQVTSDLSVSTAELRCASNFLDYASPRAGIERRLASTFAADTLHNIRNRLARAPEDNGLTGEDMDQLRIDVCGDLLSATSLAQLGRQVVDNAGDLGDRGLDEDKLMMADTFRQFASEVVQPLAQDIHRNNMIIPDEILSGVRELGCFGLSVPERYGGLLPDNQEDSLGMIVVTEELSRASLGGAGSLITRPEIMARALMEGGTEDQKRYWLPRIADGEPLCGIAITEPDYGSDVASARLKATRNQQGWLLNGSKTWSTFAGKSGVLLTLARTDPDPSLGHRGLTLFMVEKPAFDGEEFSFEQKGGGSLTGQAIPTVGYRGMHSFSLFFDDFFVPASHVVGEGQGIGKGFYYTMRGFMGGRIQTAARACGVMQAGFEDALKYACDRKVFGQPVADYQLTLVKIAKMAMYLAASRQFTYKVGRMMDEGDGAIDSSLVKLLTCKLSEWLTREAMQIHGGMGYAEETHASRYWLDARVLSIFEGTEETLALKVVGRNLIGQAS